MDNEVLIKEIETLKWQVQLLKNNIDIKSKYDSKIFENGITQEENKKIVHLFTSYAKNLDDDEISRYTFEHEMEKINSLFGKNTQLVELLLRDLAEEVDDLKYKNLFNRLYGHMNKYENVFD